VQHALHEGFISRYFDWQNRSFTAGGSASDIEIPELKEQAENIKQLLMGKFKTTVNENSLQQPQRQSSIGILTFLTYKVGWPMANCRDLAFKSTNSIKYICF
jgi:hypothetical protein